MRILIVEDERRLAEALGQIMEEQRYQADLVYDGADGLDYGLTGQYDMIVLDVMLPKLDGFEVARRLRCAHVFHPDPDAHRPGRGAGQDRRAGPRGRRLYDQTLRRRGAAGPGAGPHPEAGGGAHRAALRRGSDAGSDQPQPAAGGQIRAAGL